MKPMTTALFAVFLSLGTGIASGDTLVIPLGQQAASQVELPQRGMSTSEVLRRRGEPVRRHTAVGEPPITRWEYKDFSVYFERDRVIHSVAQHRPVAGN